MAEANFDELNVNEVLEVVEKGDISAEEALELEQKGKNRQTLVDALNDIINSDSEQEGDDDGDQEVSDEEGKESQSVEEENDLNDSSDQSDSDEPTDDAKEESKEKKPKTPKKKKVKLIKNIKYKGHRYKIGETVKIDVKDVESFAKNELIESE